MALRVLMIDDDPRLFDLLASYMRDNDVDLSHAGDGRRGLDLVHSDAFDAVLLDVMMPGIDGVEVLRRLRERSSVPVIMLTAKGDEADRVVGLELGADDYVSKPFSPRELHARIKAVLRRAQPDTGRERLVARGLVVDVAAREARVDGVRADLTGIEFDLLVALMRRPGRVIPRERLLEEAGRGGAVVGDRTVDVHISHLRRKIGDDRRYRQLIVTVRGVGYALSRDET